MPNRRSNRRRSASRSRSRGRGRGARTPRPPITSMLSAFLVVAAIGGGLFALLRWAPKAEPGPAAAGPPTAAADVQRIAVIVDPSGSNGGPAAAQQGLALIADSVASWYGAAPQSRRESQPAAGLDLHIRTVATNSYGPDAQLAHIQLPGAPGLNPAPDPRDAAATAEWAEASDGVDAAWSTGQAKAATAADEIRGLRPPSLDSEIAGSVSAAGAVMGPGEGTIILISDLEQIGPPQVAGDMAGKRLVVFQRCNGDASRCAGALSQFQGMATQWGVASFEAYRSEVLGTELGRYLSRT